VSLGYKSGIALPLSVENRCVGVLVLYTAVPDFFTGETLRLMTEMAHDLSFALSFIEKQRQAHYLAYFDSLTGLPNRGKFLDRVNHHIKEQAGTAAVLVAVIDLNRFMRINESLGREAGDALLREIAERLQNCTAELHDVARIGNDEFALVAPGILSREHAAQIIAGAVGTLFDTPYRVGRTELRVSAVIGAAMHPGDGHNADEVFEHAEAALHNAQLSQEQFLFFTPRMHGGSAEKLSLENALRLAVERREFVLHYQPVVSLDLWRIESVEALIRWNHPHRGLVPPLEFIPLLEETGLILAVGEWALSQAAADWLAWRNAGLRAPRIAVNVSPVQLRRKGFTEQVKARLGHPHDPIGLDLEITESTLMENLQDQLDNLRQLKDAGVNIIVDDFGTGYSSLGYLTRLPISALKIDRSFVASMTDTQESRLLVSTIVSLAHGLHLAVTAEGVETQDQIEILNGLHCDRAQGYLISRPIPAAAIVRLLENGGVVRPQ
jgi:diguanylate cyclase (GGDEF)-like protein